MDSMEDMEEITRLIYKYVDEDDIVSLISLCKGKPYAYMASLIATREGKLEILKELRRSGVIIHKGIDSVAISYFHMDILKWCKEIGIMRDDIALSSAAMVGNVEALIWLKEQGIHNVDIVLGQAIYKDHINVLEWAINNGYDITDRTCRSVLTYGSQYAIRLIHDKTEWYDWKCEENLCDVCNRRNIIIELVEKESGYVAWLPNHMLRLLV